MRRSKPRAGTSQGWRWQCHCPAPVRSSLRLWQKLFGTGQSRRKRVFLWKSRFCSSNRCFVLLNKVCRLLYSLPWHTFYQGIPYSNRFPYCQIHTCGYHVVRGGSALGNLLYALCQWKGLFIVQQNNSFGTNSLVYLCMAFDLLHWVLIARIGVTFKNELQYTLHVAVVQDGLAGMYRVLQLLQIACYWRVSWSWLHPLSLPANMDCNGIHPTFQSTYHPS